MLHLGCREAIKNVVIPSRRQEIVSIIQQITNDVAVSDETTTKDTLRATLMVGVGAKSYWDIVDKIKLGANKGFEGKFPSRSQTEILKFALISAKAYWDVVEPIRRKS